ncbi:MAG: NAD(P)-dependent oxidoreductase, partial [Thermoplasmata archaeon]
KIVVFGAGGSLGSRITEEFVRRGHTVKTVAHAGSPSPTPRPRTVSVVAEVTNPTSVAEAVRGADAVVSAIGPGPGQQADVILGAARGLLKGLRKGGVHRLVVVGGAGSLEVSPGVQLADTAQFPELWKPVADAHRAALEIYREEPDLEWTVVAPAAMIVPGARTGHYRAGGDQLLVDARGESQISAEDYAVAVADEVETPRHIRRRFTVAAT